MTGDGEAGGAAAAGQWAPLTTRKALAASAPGRACGLTGMTAVSFGPDRNPMAAGSCARPGVAGVFTDAGGTWRSAGLTLIGPALRDTVRVLGLAATAGGNVVLLAAGNSLVAAWWNGTRWTVSDPLAASTVRAFGFGPGGSAWLLLGGERAESSGRTGELVAGASARASRHRDPGAGDGRLVRRAGRGRVQAHRLAARPGGLVEGPADHRADPVRLLGLGGP